ncbi:MAG: PHB depolymerase family esterase [Anaerolineaceae bacterium]
MKKGSILACIIILVSMLACARNTTPAVPSPSTLPAGDSTRKLDFEGFERSYIIHVPSDYDKTQPLAVVLIFHGGGGNAENAMNTSDFNEQADRSGFLAVYPNGSGRLGDKILTWNGGTCCGYAREQNVDDVGFVRAILKDLQSLTKIDLKRIYATGISNGGIMSYRLACEASDLIAAIGPVAGTLNFTPCQPNQPVSIIHFHGTDDRHLPYAGGIGAKSLVGVDFASVQDSIQFWRDFNQCPPSPETSEYEDVEHISYRDCTQGSAVELYSIIGGGHAWPGGAGPAWVGGDQPTHTISATKVIWDFFNTHPKP